MLTGDMGNLSQQMQCACQAHTQQPSTDHEWLTACYVAWTWPQGRLARLMYEPIASFA